MSGKAVQDKDLFDQYADNYSAEIDRSLGSFGTGHDFFTRHKAWLISQLLSQSGRTAAAMSLLDVGCGVGKIHGLLEGRLGKISGADISAESIRIARHEHSECDYQTYDGQHLPNADGSFDMAMAICVFHHIPHEEHVPILEEYPQEALLTNVLGTANVVGGFVVTDRMLAMFKQRPTRKRE